MEQPLRRRWAGAEVPQGELDIVVLQHFQRRQEGVALGLGLPVDELDHEAVAERDAVRGQACAHVVHQGSVGEYPAGRDGLPRPRAG